MNRFFTWLLTLLLSFLGFSLNAQQLQEPVKRNTGFFELLGNGGYYSLNYDRILANKEKWKLSGRVGVSYLNSFDEFNSHYLGLPLEISFLKGNGPNYLELGLGATPNGEKYYMTDWTGDGKAAYWYFNLMMFPRIGYRYQLRDGGLFFKIGFTPMFTISLKNNFGYPPGRTSSMLLFGGISLGHTFR